MRKYSDCPAIDDHVPNTADCVCGLGFLRKTLWNFSSERQAAERRSRCTVHRRKYYQYVRQLTTCERSLESELGIQPELIASSWESLDDCPFARRHLDTWSKLAKCRRILEMKKQKKEPAWANTPSTR